MPRFLNENNITLDIYADNVSKTLTFMKTMILNTNCVEHHNIINLK